MFTTPGLLCLAVGVLWLSFHAVGANYTGDDMSRACDSSPCQNGATCIDSLNSGYHCICKPGYYANDCSLTYDPCADVTCYNEGLCQVRDRTYTPYCECLAHKYGTSCEFSQCLEADNHCQHDGVCRTHKPSGQHVCLCRQGFFGESCQCSYQTCDLVPCPSNHCHNSGTCYLDNDHRICRCRAQYYGPTCLIRF
ncbi:delta-like protein 4 [Ptychodera flava]|uniref:delta-like protein 4 n=1 Tax=Ptychodera flava TaxID=63121 RepID=UPI00396A5495